MRTGRVLTALLILYMVFSIAFSGISFAEEEKKNGYFTIYEEKTNKKIFCTARVVNVGDEYLDEDNNLYEIIKVEGDKAYARFKEKVDIEKSLSALQNVGDGSALKTSVLQGRRLVAIYHTHSDESYLPTDGKSSIPYKGGIFKVGEALKEALERRGITVIHSNQSHDPHDAAAYQRSRRTAMELLKKGPDALIDVHRDAVPAEEYAAQINGKSIAKVQLVVGRQNPQIESINNFAWQLKALADKKYPGLVKGIFYGKGNYNQDLFPRTILVEAGTYTNYRDKAQEGVEILADVIATTLYGSDYQKKGAPGAGGTTRVPGEGGSAVRAIFWIIALCAIGFIAYMLISTGGRKELSSKLRRFMGSEFANFLGSFKRKGKNGNQGDQTGSEG
ncbi:stage II sporulation protein P [Thermosediminibacter oceani]|uniref:Stage II sporulation protein P n=1 Tax=Thermosediminibacter oceani (strain ATCC BAA-1034 / DSM 16646 / JW/IW-1228P) TaxID=555079 RepID=D9S2V7_THEOJ|nr:stage II sporulation protein P [Thermosediminibacter oceani]ADL07734.1 stage II sporulation protein P [Thermosediminibacter oceani DSM 16646]